MSLLRSLWSRLSGQRPAGKPAAQRSDRRAGKGRDKSATPVAGDTRRVWRMSEDSPSGGWVDTAPAPMAKSEAPKPPAPPREPTSSGWLLSSLDLMTGIDVVHDADHAPGATGAQKDKPSGPPPAGPKDAAGDPKKSKPRG